MPRSVDVDTLASSPANRHGLQTAYPTPYGQNLQVTVLPRQIDKIFWETKQG